MLDLKQVASYSWKFGRSAGPLCEAVSSPGKPFLFVWSFGGGGSFLQEGCEFAEELLHKENVPHCLQGDGVCQMDPFFCVWFLKGVFAHPVRFEQGLSYLRVSCYPTPNWETLLNVKCFLLMCWAAVWISGTVNHTVYPRGACVL